MGDRLHRFDPKEALNAFMPGAAYHGEDTGVGNVSEVSIDLGALCRHLRIICKGADDVVFMATAAAGTGAASSRYKLLSTVSGAVAEFFFENPVQVLYFLSKTTTVEVYVDGWV